MVLTLEIVIIILILLFCFVLFIRYHNHNPSIKYSESFFPDKNYFKTMPIYIINLKHRPERLVNIMNELKKLSITEKDTNLHVLDAFNGKDINLKGLIKSGVIAPRNDSRYRFMRKGEFGCYFSHIQCWINILFSGQEYGLVVEDDAVFNDDTLAKFNKYFDKLQNQNHKWDVFPLGQKCYHETLDKCLHGEDIGESLVYPKLLGYATFAYIIKRETILKLLKTTYPIKQPVDVVFINMYDSGDLHIVVNRDNISVQRNSTDSDTKRIK